MKVNITAGECLKEILIKLYPLESFIAFNEDMINGSFNDDYFSNEFILNRAKFHLVSIEEYKNKLNDFLLLLDNLNNYEEIVLWFGDEPFCNKNSEVVIKTLLSRNYQGKIIKNIVNEYNGTILKTIIIKDNK